MKLLLHPITVLILRSRAEGVARGNTSERVEENLRSFYVELMREGSNANE